LIFAARSRGKNVVYATDTGLIEVGKNVYKRHPNVSSKVRPVPVGYHPPNPLGFYDMTGNIDEFVEDWYETYYYEKSPINNPKGPRTGTEKVQRGAVYLVLDGTIQIIIVMYKKSFMKVLTLEFAVHYIYQQSIQLRNL